MKRSKIQDSKGGDAGEGSEVALPKEPAPATSGARIVINPRVFKDDRDALCVAFNEAFRIAMEEMEFNPVSEPTPEQRKFFSDTAYADDELQLRRTILARICTFDTSVEDPTDEQLEESVEFLQAVLESGIPQNDWEAGVVNRTAEILSTVRARGKPVSGSPEAAQ
jgi:hypothetical protein